MTFVGEWATGLGVHICLTKHSCHRQRVPRSGRERNHQNAPWTLIDAIEAAKDGETDYFRFKCFRNRNLHLEFKRLDLVAKLNAVAGGMRLRGEPTNKRADAG